MKKKEILFLRRSIKCSRPGGWDFPGGGIDFGEDPTAGIMREVEEETQLHINEIEPIHLESTVNTQGDFVVMVGYRAKTADTVPILSWEYELYTWLDMTAALKIEMPEIHKKFLEIALSKEFA